jgi:hypothetical protein
MIAPAYSIGRSKRTSNKKTVIPGPGEYCSNGMQSKNMPKWGFSKQDRLKGMKEGTPGPGAY